MKLSSLEIETATASWRGGLSTLLLSASLALVLVLSPAGRAGAVERLVITGSSTIAPLVLQIARRYEQAHPGLRIDVQSGGSSRGLTDVRRGVADIGMSSRALKPEKRQGAKTETIARDGVAAKYLQSLGVEPRGETGQQPVLARLAEDAASEIAGLGDLLRHPRPPAAMLRQAKEFARAAQFQVLLGDAEAVFGLAQYFEAGFRRLTERVVRSTRSTDARSIWPG